MRSTSVIVIGRKPAAAERHVSNFVPAYDEWNTGSDNAKQHSLSPSRDEPNSTTGDHGKGKGISELQLNELSLFRGRTHESEASNTDHSELLSQKFAKQPTFSTLCVEALSIMSREDMVRTLDKLLEGYYMELTKQTRSPIEDAVIDVLRARSTRDRIAGAIVDRVTLPEVDVERRNQGTNRLIHGEGQSELYRRPSARSSLAIDIAANDFPRTYMGTERTRGSNDFPDFRYEVFPERDNEEQQESEPVRLLSSTGTLDRLLFGKAFNFLLVGLRSSYRPPPSPSLMRILLSVPESEINIVHKFKASRTDKLRLWIEHLTNEVWEWWPLQPLKPDLAPGFIRISWICVSHEHCTLSWEALC
jgi:hypothetical protein